MPRTRAALAFAAQRHAGQRRDVDGAPFMMHPIEVASLLHEAGYPDEVVAAGVLHDVLEDTDAERSELARRFGMEVAELVAALTEDPSIPDRAERKAALRRQVAEAGNEAAAVFAADKVSKARELRLRMENGPPDESTPVKVAHYSESLAMLAETIPDQPLVAQLREELQGLDLPRGAV
jgi:(p)ppGpp synthase/HD superfamily hydrolase